MWGSRKKASSCSLIVYEPDKAHLSNENGKCNARLSLPMDLLSPYAGSCEPSIISLTCSRAVSYAPRARRHSLHIRQVSGP
jgi:hypothetical protein